MSKTYLQPYENACRLVKGILCDDPRRLESVLRAAGLKPKPKRGGGFCMPCPLHNSADGEPLTVSINGKDQHMQILCGCFNPACTCPKDIVSLVKELKGLDKASQALNEIVRVLGYQKWQDVPGEAIRAVRALPVPVMAPAAPTAPIAALNGIPSVGTQQPSSYLRGRGISRDVIRSHGCYDEDRRVIIPVADECGKQVGWIARTTYPYCPTCGEFHDMRKLCRSGQTTKYACEDGFNRGKYLFNLDRACRTGSRNLIVVEGALDVMRLESFGILSVVALLGSKATEHQLRDLMAYPFGQIHIALDNDKAGKAAAYDLRAKIDNVKAVRIVPLPNDPAALTADQIEKHFGSI